MKLQYNKISTCSTPKSFEDLIKDYRESKVSKNIKTASTKVAEQEEADSSGQLDVEPLHQEGESTTMPKAGPSAKKDDGAKSATSTKEPDTEGDSSGQPEAEGTEKFTNDPKTPSKEEKGGSTGESVKVAEITCDKCKKPCDKCQCEGCNCKACVESKEVKEAGIKGNCSKCGKPNFICKGKCGDDASDKDSSDDKDTTNKIKEDDKEEDNKEEKEAAVKKCEKCKCDPCECKDMSCGSSKKVEFVKIANLDEKNKGFLKEYWRQLFGDDYVNALIADK